MKYSSVILLLVGCSESVDATHRDVGTRSDASVAGRGGTSGRGTGGGGAPGGDRDATTQIGNGGAVVLAEGGPCAPVEGGTGTWSPMFSGDPAGCKTCVESLDAYCAATDGCVPLSQWKCGRYGSLVMESIERGCGYVRFSYSGDVSDHWGRVYDETTRKVVYGWNNGRLSAGCNDALVAGVLPECASWTTLECADGGIPPTP